MAKISDDSDNQRIREMQEAELRNRADLQKKDTEQRISKAFSDVMRDKAQKKEGEKIVRQDAQKGSDERTAREKNVLNSLLKKSPKESAELSRRAAMSSALQGNLSKTQQKNATDTARAQSTRVEDMDEKGRSNKEIDDKDLREHDTDESRRDDEKQVDQKFATRDAELRGELQRTDQDGHRRNDNRSDDQQGRDDQQRRAAAVEGKQKPQGAHVPRISQELIDRIVSAIHTAHIADGRTEMHVDLKGSMLEGIRLKVHAENGKVRCTFEGCDKEMKSLLEASKGALMRGLAKKGMTLASLDVR
jgi:hypothetical protein